MSPELREFVLSLPVNVRRELLKVKCDAAYGLTSTQGAWDLLRMSPDVVPLYMVSVEDEKPPVCAVVPISPIAIALHAARLAKRFDSHWVELRVYPCFRFEHYGCYLGSNPSPRHQPDIGVDGQSVKDDDSDCDPTGHRAAIALLQKVMDERKVPNAKP